MKALRVPFAAAALTVLAPAWGQVPSVGQPYPDFVLPRASDGAPVSLSQFRGKKVLLFHFASW